MLENVKVDIVRIAIMVTAFYAVTGCGNKDEQANAGKAPKPEPKTVVSPEPKAVVSNDTNKASVSVKTNRYPEVKLPSYLEETKNMPAGMAKSRAVQLKYIEIELKKLETQMRRNSEEISAAEKKARVADPALGKLYKELVDKQIEYRTALAKSKNLNSAKESNKKTLERYILLNKRRKTLINLKEKK